MDDLLLAPPQRVREGVVRGLLLPVGSHPQDAPALALGLGALGFGLDLGTEADHVFGRVEVVAAGHGSHATDRALRPADLAGIGPAVAGVVAAVEIPIHAVEGDDRAGARILLGGDNAATYVNLDRLLSQERRLIFDGTGLHDPDVADVDLLELVIVADEEDRRLFASLHRLD